MRGKGKPWTVTTPSNEHTNNAGDWWDPENSDMDGLAWVQVRDVGIRISQDVCREARKSVKHRWPRGKSIHPSPGSPTHKDLMSKFQQAFEHSIDRQQNHSAPTSKPFRCFPAALASDSDPAAVINP